ncbi:hypothetical protein MYSE111917_01010 [Mycobacterium senriense]
MVVGREEGGSLGGGHRGAVRSDRGGGGSLAAAIPPLVQQAREFTDQAPHYIQHIGDHSSWIGRLNDRFRLQQRITETVNGSGGPVVGQAVKAGKAVFGAVADVVVVAVLTVYFLADFPRIRATLYRFVPRSRRPRAILLGDQVFAKVGAYVFGNIVISAIAGVASFVWPVIFDVPYPLLLGIFVALLDLIPFGSSVAGVIVAAVALTVSIPVASQLCCSTRASASPRTICWYPRSSGPRSTCRRSPHCWPYSSAGSCSE